MIFGMLRLQVDYEYTYSKELSIHEEPPAFETNQEIEIGDTPFSTREEITRLAYVYWEERGKPLGSDEEDWFRAEWELQVRQGASKLQLKTARRLRVALMELRLDASPSNNGCTSSVAGSSNPLR